MKLIQKGSYGSDVKKWQTFLKQQGYYSDKIDSDFGKNTDTATKAFQKDHGLRVDGIVGKWTIQKAQELGFLKGIVKFTREVNELIVHITAGGNSSFESILNGHLAKGWKDIGYHFLIIDGEIYEGRDLEVIGAHCSAKNKNVGTIGYAFDNKGNDFKADAEYGEYISEADQAALERLTAYLIQQFGLSIDKVSGHNDYDKGKACPCFKVRKAKVFKERVQELLKSKVEIKIIPRKK